MEKAKEYLIRRILQDIHGSDVIEDKVNLIFKNKEDLMNYINFFCDLSEHKMTAYNCLNNIIYKEKYKPKNKRLLGDKNRVIPDDVYKKLIKETEKEFGKKIKLALEVEGIEGARGEDVVRIKLEDIDFNEHKIRIINRKVGGRVYTLPLNPNLEYELKAFISQNKDKIISHNGFIFFSENPVQKRDFISEKYLKNVVYKILDKLGLRKIYAKSRDGRNLSQYTLHGLRGHAATRINEKTHDLKKVQELLNHQPGSADTTMVYIERDPEDDLKGVI